jgi:hypothetical protein
MRVRLRALRPQPSGDHRAEGEHPAPDALVRDHGAPLGQELLDIPEAERELEVHPHGALDDIGWEAVAGVRQWGHVMRLRCRAEHGKAAERDKPGY